MKKTLLIGVLLFSVLSCISNHSIMDNSNTASDSQYKPSEMVYNAAFTEINDLIDSLNEIIQARKYEIWLDFLTEEYKTEKSDPQFLSELSNTPTLVSQKIFLRSLKDYFEYVIVPSRAKAKLDKIVFSSESKVKALGILYGKSVILYYLVRTKSAWKIGTANNFK
jgi:hypothetical protein